MIISKKTMVISLAALAILALAGAFIYTQKVTATLTESCKEPSSEEDMVQTQICTYNTKSFQAVYQQIRNKRVAPEVKRLLREALPNKDVEDTFKNAYAMSASYQYTAHGDLLLTVNFAGGVDEYELKHQHNQTVLTITNSAD